MKHLCGAIPDRPSSRKRDASISLRRVLGELGVRQYALDNQAMAQFLTWIRRQGGPSCVGQLLAEWVDATTRTVPWASAVSLWREARRRQGQIENILAGTRIEYAVEGLIHRGWDDYEPGEEQDETEAGMDAPPAGDDLRDELFAHDKHQHGKHYRIADVREQDILDSVDAALALGFGVGGGFGLKDPFFGFQGDPNQTEELLDATYIGGFANGHALRIYGRFVSQQGDRCYLVQNSWGTSWGGTYNPATGQWDRGCFAARGAVIADAWDLHVFEVQR